MIEAIPPPTPPTPHRTYPGISQSIKLILISNVLIVGVGLAIEQIKGSAGINLSPFTGFLIMQAVAWPTTIGLGLHWGQVSLREACPMGAFPGRILAALCVTCFGLTILMTSVLSMIPMSASSREDLTRAYAGSSPLAIFLSAVVVAPLAEEMFFRGLVLRGFLGRYSTTKAVWASSVIFALFHLDLRQAAIALTAGLGWTVIAGATLVADALDLLPATSAGDFGAIVPQLAYISLLGAVVAVLTWNASVRRIGPQNAALFGNLIPVTAFAIAIARGYQPRALELGGAGLTLAALVAANMLARRRLERAPVARPSAAPAAGRLPRRAA